MKDHWERIGYHPETDSLNGVDEDTELQVQVGRNEKEPILIPDSTLKSKYQSVIIKGFKADTTLETILKILSEHGLPSKFQSKSLVRNDKLEVSL